ncbi:Nanos-like 1 [Brachionus plicatilis]|uniref:Nanos-like 1 n=1 Tax=Brachionus plicatilis TaxID=10195 RepID=A0A3M7QSJ8_BRAPC|nr:Nanos-like 1 [Brachionus plicatilis]
MFVNPSYLGSPLYNAPINSYVNASTGHSGEPYSLFNHQETALSDYFNSLVLCERIWSPLDPLTINAAESSRNFQHPVAHSTPRAIRKTPKKQTTTQNDSEDFKFENNQANDCLNMRKADYKPTKAKQIRKNPMKYSLESSINSTSSFSPNVSKKKLPLRSQGIDLSEFLKKKSDSCSSWESSSYGAESCFSKFKCKDKVNIKDRCLFCENNGEPEEIYMSHPLKDSLGKVVCPILRNFTCPKCGESGDYAHTNKYCPETQRRQKENKIKKFLNLKD